MKVQHTYHRKEFGMLKVRLLRVHGDALPPTTDLGGRQTEVCTEAVDDQRASAVVNLELPILHRLQKELSHVKYVEEDVLDNDSE